LEDKIGVDKEINEEDFKDIPLQSRFIAALRCIAFYKVSSSVVTEPSSTTACRALHLEGGAHGTTGVNDSGEVGLEGDVVGV
jgi:hypothetical protein